MRHEVEALRVEVEHSQEVVRLLSAKVERERRAVATVDRELEEEYRVRHQTSLDRYHGEVQTLTGQLNELLQRKKDLVERCRELAGQAQRAEEDAAESVRKLHKEAELGTEREKKIFRAGFEERLQQVTMDIRMSCRQTSFSLGTCSEDKGVYGIDSQSTRSRVRSTQIES